MSYLDGLILHGIENLQARDDFAGAKNLNLKTTFSNLGNVLRELGNTDEAILHCSRVPEDPC